MAVDLIATDAMFPDYRPGMDTDAYLKENNNYLFLLKESLNYTLHNLGVANFNARQLQTISDIITKPIVMALVGEDGQLTSIQADLEGIKTTVGTVEGNVTTIKQDVDGLSASVTSIDGKYSSLSQTVSGFEKTVTEINNNYISKSSATQSASGFKFEVMDSNHEKALVTLDKSGITIKGGGISIKNSTNQEVLKADTDGNLTLKGTVDSSAIYGSAFVTCSKSDYQSAANGASNAQFIQIGDGIIKSFMGNSLYGFEAAAVGTSSYFSLNYNNTSVFKVYSNGSGNALIQGSGQIEMVASNSIYFRGQQLRLDLDPNVGSASISIESDGIHISASGNISMNGNVNIQGSLTANGTILA